MARPAGGGKASGRGLPTKSGKKTRQRKTSMRHPSRRYPKYIGRLAVPKHVTPEQRLLLTYLEAIITRGKSKPFGRLAFFTDLHDAIRYLPPEHYLRQQSSKTIDRLSTKYNTPKGARLLTGGPPENPLHMVFVGRYASGELLIPIAEFIADPKKHPLLTDQLRKEIGELRIRSK